MSSKNESPTTQLLKTYSCIALWVALSSCVILVNKAVLDPNIGGFPYPLALAALHMLACSLLSMALVASGAVEAPPMPVHVYVKGVLPIGALFALTLWASNAAYLHLSVSFIQMAKAATPLLVYALGVAAGAERFERGYAGVMAAIAGGVALASYGELRFEAAGAALQALALAAEAGRLVMVQLLLQARGVQLNPITTMYHVSPVCFVCLFVPFSATEAPRALAAAAAGAGALGRLLALSAAAAFGLNAAVYLLVGRAGALTLNVAGVVKDVGLIAASVALHGSIVTVTQVVGYAVAMAGVLRYNALKLRRGQRGATATTTTGGSSSNDSSSGTSTATHNHQQQRQHQQQHYYQQQQQHQLPQPQMQPLLPSAAASRRGAQGLTQVLLGASSGLIKHAAAAAQVSREIEAL